MLHKLCFYMAQNASPDILLLNSTDIKWLWMFLHAYSQFLQLLLPIQ